VRYLFNAKPTFQTKGKNVLKKYPDLFVRFDDYEIEIAKKKEYPLKSKHPLVNDKWDRLFLELFCSVNKTWLKGLAYDEFEEEAGHGDHEVLNWVALSGAMNAENLKLLLYEPVTEWICGMRCIDYGVEE
jgi:2,3-dihydroxyphenylpropionate 1,2-dioxygenase